jgi:DNA primase
MDYYFDAFTADLDLATAKGKADAVRALGPLIAGMGDRVQRTHYLQQLARMVQVDERSLWQQIRQTAGRQEPSRPRRSEPQVEESGETPLGLDGHCLAFVLYHPALLSRADEVMAASEEPPLAPEDLSRPDDRAILEAWRGWLANGKAADARGPFYDTLDERLQDRVDTLVKIQKAQPEAPEELLRDQVLDAIARLRLRNLRRKNRELQFLQEEARASGDREMYRSHVQSIVDNTTRIRRLEQAVNQRSISGRRQHEDTTLRVPATAVQ